MVAVTRRADPRHCRTCVGQGHAWRGSRRAGSLRSGIRAPGRGTGLQKLLEQSQLSGKGGREEPLHLPEQNPPPSLLLPWDLRKELEER